MSAPPPRPGPTGWQRPSALCRHRSTDRGEIAQQAQSRAARLLRVELRAEDVAALDGANEALAVLRGAEHVVRGRGPRRERVDGKRLRLGEARRVGTSAQVTGDQPMCGTLRSVGPRPETGPSTDPGPRPSRSSDDSKISWRPRQMPKTGTADETRSAISSSSPRSGSAPSPREGADPGQDHPVARRARSWSGSPRRRRQHARAPSRPT